MFRRYTPARMLSLFKRDKSIPTTLTFKTRVAQFWAWYAEVAPRFYETIEARKCPDLTSEVSAKVEELVPGFAWVFGPGEHERGHSFTLTGEGDFHRQLLTQYWLGQAPTLSGWTFYAARQPGQIRGQHLKMDGRKLDPIEIWITPFINHDGKKIDITVWHPLFETMQEEELSSVLFIFLDEALGEYSTQQWIGEIKLEPTKLADSFPLEELNEFLKRIQMERGWTKLPPGESAMGYQFEEQHNHFLRGDVITGTTMHFGLIDEYLEAEGGLEDPLSGTGADYVFVAFDARILPVGSEVAVRAEIEDALDEALRVSASGRLLGGAWGKENAYIDLLLFDGPASIEMVLGVLREKNLPAGTSINYFAKEKRGHRRIL